MEFTKYKRKEFAELRPVDKYDIEQFIDIRDIVVDPDGDNLTVVSISDEDRKNNSPKIGDMIARNPKNHLDQWLVSEQYFKDNFEKQ